MLPFSVTFRPGVPPYEEIVTAVKRAIALGRLQPGDSFPSVRSLSRELKLNPNTCQKAVAALTAAGMLEVRPGIGTLVCEPPALSPEETRALLADNLETLLVEARRLGLSRDELIRLLGEQWDSFR